MRDLEVMTLTSVSILRKYLGIIDVNFIMDEWQAWRFNVLEAYNTLAEHNSQLVWFRKLFVVFSRYTYVNSFYRYVQTGASTATGGESSDAQEIVDEDVARDGNRATSKKHKGPKIAQD